MSSKKEHKRTLIGKDTLKMLEDKNKLADEYLDHLQRLQAEFENYRKRMVKEKREFKEFAIEDFIYELLPVLDSFDRAIITTQNTTNIASCIEGMKMVRKQLQDCLKSKKLEEIRAIGEQFNPQHHEAIAYEEMPDSPPNTVVEEFQKGYLLNGRVLRPAMVKVVKEPQKHTKNEDDIIEEDAQVMKGENENGESNRN